MAWFYLIIAGFFEVAWAYAMKQSDGFTKWLPTLIMVITMLISFGLLAFSMRSLPLGTAYTVWTGIGAVGSFFVGIGLLSEPINTMRITAAVLIIAGLILMKLSS